MQTLEDRALDGPLGGVTDEQSSPDVTSGIDQPGPGFIPPPPPSVPSSGSWVPSEMAMQVMGLIVLAVFVGIVIYSVGAGLLLRNSTPTGGDMGAHVWAPDAVRRELLPHGRLIGWSDDWYAGFPVLGFYFPFPSWTIALLSFVLPYNIAFKFVTVAGLVAMPITGWALGRQAGLKRPVPVLFGAITTVFLMDRQYTIYGGNIASTMAGEFSFAISLCLALLFIGLAVRILRTGEKRATAAVVLAVVGLSHLLPTIWAGVAVLFAVLTHIDAKRTNIRNAYAMVAVSGILGGGLYVAGYPKVGIVVGAGLALATVVYDHRTHKLGLGQFGDLYAAIASGAALAGFWLLPFASHLAYSNDMGYEKERKYIDGLFPFWADKPPSGTAVFAIAFLLAIVGALYCIDSFLSAIIRDWSRQRSTWHGAGMAFAGVTGLLVTIWRMDYLGDWRGITGCFLGVSLMVMLVLFGPFVDGHERLGLALVGATAASALAFRFMPYGFRLWNNRWLPFWTMGIYLLSVYGMVAIGRGVASSLRWLSKGQRTFPAAPLWGTLAGGVIVFSLIAMPLGMIPRWFPSPKVSKGLLGIQQAGDSADFNNSIAQGWPPYNFQGYQGRPDWPEYKNVVDVMAQVGKTNGCGRTHWEYEEQQSRWGTPMALMLLPYWTNGCIKSMEGLYFESSATTPYHFMDAALLSKAPSNPERDLPYEGLNVAKGVQKLQQFGVKYYMAFSTAAIAQADVNPDLKLLRTTPYKRSCTDAENTAKACPTTWKIYEVAGSQLVEPLKLQPAVVTGIGASQQTGWLDLGVSVYKNAAQYPVPLVASGPKEWERVTATVNRPPKVRTYGDGFALQTPKSVPLDAVTVTSISPKSDGISFSVDKVGVPVMVKMSYFPNFQVSGGKGPYRVAPNLMVVIPTSKNVAVTYGRTGADWAGMFAALAGMAGAILLYLGNRTRRRRPATAGLPVDQGDSELASVSAAPLTARDSFFGEDAVAIDTQTASLPSASRNPAPPEPSAPPQLID